MKKGSLLLTALLTASFLVACENKGGGEQPQQQEQTQQEEQAPQQQEQTTQEQATEEQTTEEQTTGEENTGAEEGATQGENTTGENTENQGGEQSGEAQGGNNEQAQAGENAGGGDVKKGQQLFTANGCTACHQEKADTVGPSLAKISQAYAGKKEDLIKFLKGEGKAIVDPAKFSIMQPNLAKTKALSDGDLSALADYILSVK